MSYRNFTPPFGTKLNQADPINNRLIGAWLLNEAGGGKALDSLGTNHGTIGTSAPPWAQTANLGQTAYFNGVSTAYITLQRDKGLDLERTDAFSASLWVKPYTNTPISQTIIGNIGEGPAYAGWEISLYNGFSASRSLFFQMINSNISDHMAVRSADGTILADNLYHCAVVYDGSSSAYNVKLYINGVPVSTAIDFNSLTKSILVPGAPAIGGRPSTGHWPFCGRIGVVRTYNRVISEQEVKRLYTEPYAGLLYPPLRGRDLHTTTEDFIPRVIFMG